MPNISVNGKNYDRVEDMPPEARQAYQRALGMLADKNQNGTPDVLEAGLPAVPAAPAGKIKLTTHVRFTTAQKIVFNGQVYHSVDEMPAEARQAYQQALGTLDADQNGVPDILEGDHPPASFSTRPITATPIIPAVPSDQCGDGQRLRRIAATVVVLLLGLAAVAAIVVNIWLSRVPR
jgi:hypothetical protein